MEEFLAHHLRLDGVVTLVDAMHATRHIEEEKPDGVVNEAVEQIAYADRIILNKVMMPLDNMPLFCDISCQFIGYA
jgi:G3E family GTPase